MTPYQKRPTPITQRMAGDMKIRNLAQATIDAYTYQVGKFAEFIGKKGKELEAATPEDVRDFQLHLIEVRKVGWSSFNQAVCGLRFLYSFTLPKPWPIAMIPFGKRPRKLPTVLSVEEVDALLSCTPNLKHRTFLMTPGTDRRLVGRRAKTVRSGRSGNRRYRQSSNATPHRPWEGQQGTTHSTLATIAEGTADVLA